MRPSEQGQPENNVKTLKVNSKITYNILKSKIDKLLLEIKDISDDALYYFIEENIEPILERSNIYLLSKTGFGEYLDAVNLSQTKNNALLSRAPTKKSERIIEKLFRDMMSINDINNLIENNRQKFIDEVADIYRFAIIFKDENVFYENIQKIIYELEKTDSWETTSNEYIDKCLEIKNKSFDEYTKNMVIYFGQKKINKARSKGENVSQTIIDYFIEKDGLDLTENLDTINLTLECISNFNAVPKIELFKCKSFMPSGDGYTGINMVYKYNFNPYLNSPLSIPIEIQFHTEKTYNSKNAIIELNIEIQQDIYELLNMTIKDYKTYVGDEYYNPDSEKYLIKFIKYINPDWNIKPPVFKKFNIKQHRIYRLTQIFDFVAKRLNVKYIELKKQLGDTSSKLKSLMMTNENILVKEIFKKNDIITEDTVIFKNKNCRYTGINICDNRHDSEGELLENELLEPCLDELQRRGLTIKK